MFSTYPKVSVPLKFMGASYGAWTAYAGVAYFHLRNEGLLDGNQVLANPERKENLARIRAGVIDILLSASAAGGVGSPAAECCSVPVI